MSESYYRRWYSTKMADPAWRARRAEQSTRLAAKRLRETRGLPEDHVFTRDRAERTEALRLVDLGMSYSAVAAKVGISRNAVAGMVYRRRSATQ